MGYSITSIIQLWGYWGYWYQVDPTGLVVLYGDGLWRLSGGRGGALGLGPWEYMGIMIELPVESLELPSESLKSLESWDCSEMKLKIRS